jgi:potassium-dependent mechanosensitive channel
VKKHHLLLFTLICLLLQSVPAISQISVTSRHENKPHRKKTRRASDSLWRKDLVITDTSAALIINRIEDINTTLNDINDVIENGYDTTEITENLPVYERNIRMVKYNISSLSGSLNLNNLSLIRNRLDEMSGDLKDWQSSLLAYYTELVGMNTQMRTMYLDSTVRELPNDTALKFLYLRQLKELKTKWLSTDTITRKNLLKIDLLQTHVSNQYIEVVELQKEIKELLKAYNKKAFGKEYGYLWEKPEPETQTKSLSSLLRESSRMSLKSLQFYFGSGWGRRVINIAAMLIFFLWTYINLRKIKKNNPEALSKLQYLDSFPLLASLVVMFILAPLLDLHPPSVYLEMLQFLLIAVLTLIFAKRWPRILFLYWLVLVGIFTFYILKNQLAESHHSTRILSFVIDIFSIFVGWTFFRRVRKSPGVFPGYFQSLIFIYLLLNLTAAACNLFGRVTLSQVIGSAGISNFIQAIGLIVFIHVFLEAVYLQLEVDKKSKRFTSYLNYQNVELRLRNVLTLIAGIFWFINLTQNLNLYDAAYNTIADFLDTERTVGSTSFTLGSILIFFFVIWIANLLQKYLGYFFGDTGEEILPDRKLKLGTSILLVRLLILTGGFFLGILASGIPLDRVTIIIGALGVGIGLGLQSIVNNLVSGVILAIERPIQVGDIIEIGSSSGRVKEIGIRSSRIITAEGAEVIVPNGDMLSQKLTNWTIGNTHLRIEIDLKLGNGADADRTKKIIMDLISQQQDIMPKPEAQVLFKSLSQSGAELQVLFWAFDINKWGALKSEMLESIYSACLKEGISLI